MELVSFLQKHEGLIGWSARTLSKSKKVEEDDALQLLLVSASDLLQDVVADLDGKFTHLRAYSGPYTSVLVDSKSLGYYITKLAYRSASDTLKSKQRLFEEEIAETRYADPQHDAEPGIVVQDLLKSLQTHVTRRGGAHVAILRDLLANEGLEDYTPGTRELWTSERRRGRSEDRLSNEFIFNRHGLTLKQGRLFLSDVRSFLTSNGF